MNYYFFYLQILKITIDKIKYRQLQLLIYTINTEILINTHYHQHS
jgi:transcriptional regulator of met regulon